MMEFITFPRIIMMFSAAGVWFINFKKQRIGFIFFAIAATGWAVYDWHIGQIEQMTVMSVNAGLSLAGWFRWGK